MFNPRGPLLNPRVYLPNETEPNDSKSSKTHESNLQSKQLETKLRVLQCLNDQRGLLYVVLPIKKFK